MDEILMQQHTSFEHKLTSIQQANHTLDQLTHKLNSYFNSNTQGISQRHLATNNLIQRDKSIHDYMHSENYEGKRIDDSEEEVSAFRRTSVNAYSKVNGRGEEQQLQFKIYTNNKNNSKKNRNTKSQKDYNISEVNNATTKTEQAYLRPSVTQKQLPLPSRQTPNIPSRNVSINKRKKSQEFRLFSRPPSVEKGKRVTIRKQQTQENNDRTKKLENSSKTKKQNLLSESQEQMNRHRNSGNRKYHKYSQNSSPDNRNQQYNKEKQADELQINNYQLEYNISKGNQQNISFVGNSNIHEKNRHRLVNQIETVQILMKERLAAKKGIIKQIEQEIATQNEERVYLYKVNVRLNQQLKLIQHQEAVHGAQITSNQEWRRKILQEQVQKLKKQITKKKNQRKQLRKEEQTLKQAYQTMLNNKKSILRKNIENYAIEESKTKQNTQVLQDLIQQLDRLRDAVSSKIKNKITNPGSIQRKVIKSFKN